MIGRDNPIASKALYFVYVIAIAISFMFLAIVFYIAFINEANSAVYALVCFNSIYTIVIYLFVRRLIWLDISEITGVTFGNIFFTSQVKKSNLESVSKAWFGPNIYSINIEGSNLYFISHLGLRQINSLIK